jgi:hypothetical protein
LYKKKKKMSDHLVLYVDRVRRIDAVHPIQPQDSDDVEAAAEVDRSGGRADMDEEDDDLAEDEPLIAMAECRICQEEDYVNSLETPCGCSGGLKYAHRKCVQHWCNEKGDIICEICHQPYQSGYTAPPRPAPEETAIDIGGGWTISGTPLDLRDPRLLAIAEAERHILKAQYDEYAASTASRAAFCRSAALCRLAALILMVLLLLRHALIGDGGNDDVSTIFSLLLLRAGGFLLPCFIMAWAIIILQRRRQRQEAAALVAQVAVVLLLYNRART